MKVAERLKNLENQYKEVLESLASLTNPNDSIQLIQMRERLTGAIELAQAIIEEEKEEDATITKSSKV